MLIRSQSKILEKEPSQDWINLIIIFCSQGQKIFIQGTALSTFSTRNYHKSHWILTIRSFGTLSRINTTEKCIRVIVNFYQQVGNEF